MYLFRQVYILEVNIPIYYILEVNNFIFTLICLFKFVYLLMNTKAVPHEIALKLIDCLIIERLLGIFQQKVP